MKLSAVIKVAVLGSLCVLLADGFQVSEDGSPHIIGAQRVQIKANPGEPLILDCDALTNNKDGVTLIYWLVNGTFPEERSSSGRIIELDQSTLDNGAILQRRLLLKSVTLEDLRFTFTCVVMSAGGAAQKEIKLRRIRKKEKH